MANTPHVQHDESLKVTYASSSVSLHHCIIPSGINPNGLHVSSRLSSSRHLHCTNRSSGGCLSPIPVRLSEAQRIILRRGELTAHGAQRSVIGTQRSEQISFLQRPCSTRPCWHGWHSLAASPAENDRQLRSPPLFWSSRPTIEVPTETSRSMEARW